MADILTHLRELSFGYGILKYNYTNFTDTPVQFLDFCQNNIKYCSHLTIKHISKSKISFNVEELNTIRNGLNLANYVLSKNIIKNDKPNVEWIGGETQSGSASDIIIDNIPFSLKEDSFILHNMGLYQLINIIIDKVQYSRGLHIFEEFSKDKLEEWYKTTRDIMIEKLKLNSFQIQDSNNRNIKLSYSASADKLYLFFFDNEEYIYNFSTSSYSDFKKSTSSRYREKVFSKFLNQELSNNIDYLKTKKICSEKAGENLVSFLNEKVEKNPSIKSLFNLFRIEKNSYYYAKTTTKGIHLYKIPSQAEFSSKVKITNITSAVPQSQLNIYTTIENVETKSKLVVRNELRYSHGQFNGTPEAKMYIDNGSLLIAYEEV